MTIELPEELDIAFKAHAEANGVSPDLYVRNLVQRDPGNTDPDSQAPFETGYGMSKKYGASISAEEIGENRADMWSSI